MDSACLATEKVNLRAILWRPLPRGESELNSFRTVRHILTLALAGRILALVIIVAFKHVSQQPLASGDGYSAAERHKCSHPSGG